MALQGASLVAVDHSYPTTIPEPSRQDLVEAGLPEVLNVIVGFKPEVAFRAWRFQFAGAEHAVATCEVPLIISDVSDLLRIWPRGQCDSLHGRGKMECYS
jgi:hypothetical protein